MSKGMIAVDITGAPDSVKREIEALSSQVNGSDMFENMSEETRHWVIKNSDNDAVAKKMSSDIEHVITLVDIFSDGFDMLPMVVGEEKSDKMMLDLYNVCARFVAKYNVENS